MLSTNQLTDPKMEYVKYYRDYLSKYGIGYVFTNEMIGFYYNDSTNIFWNNEKKQYGYSEFFVNESKPEIIYISETTPEKAIYKKIKILKKFIELVSKRNMVPKISIPYKEIAIVRQIKKTKYGIFFQLSDNVLQMWFGDNSQVIFCLNTKMLIYIGKNNGKKYMKFTDNFAAVAGDDIVKKLKYTLRVFDGLNSKIKMITLYNYRTIRRSFNVKSKKFS